GKPTNGIEAKHLLTGLVRCSVCGGGLYVTSRSHGRQRSYYYACTSFHRRGHTVCSNNRQAIMDDADLKAMEILEDELLDPLVIEAAVEKARRPSWRRQRQRRCVSRPSTIVNGS